MNSPIQLEFKPAVGNAQPSPLRTFTSYSFSKNLLTPASPFRFTAGGVEKEIRTAIRSGDTVSLSILAPDGTFKPVGTGFIDETDAHVTATSVDYVLTGRDPLGQLVDNTAIDKDNRIRNTENVTMQNILSFLLEGTRIPKGFRSQQVPNGTLIFHTNPGETKINALQRYLQFTNCLVWCDPSGQVVIGKPNFTQARSGNLILKKDGKGNNLLEARVRRNLNQAIRQVVVQLQTLGQVDPTSYTKINSDPDMRRVREATVGRSVYATFTYGQGEDTVNTVTQVGNQSGNPRKIGDEMALRQIARENMKIIEVECVVQGHINNKGEPYNVDQIYNVQIEDEDVSEDMLVHSCDYEMTMDHGMLTRLRLARLGTICAFANSVGG